jgi:hypothetical protein
MSQSAKHDSKEDEFIHPVGVLGGGLLGATCGAYLMGKRDSGLRDLEDTVGGAAVGGFAGLFAGGLWFLTLPLASIGLVAIGGAYVLDEIPFEVTVIPKGGSSRVE